MRRGLVGLALITLLLVSARAENLPEGWRDAATDPAATHSLEQVLERERAVGGYGDMTPLAANLLKAAEGENDPGAAARLARLAVKAAPADPRSHAYLLKLAATRLFEPTTAIQALGGLLRSLATDPWVQSVSLLRAAVVGCSARHQQRQSALWRRGARSWQRRGRRRRRGRRERACACRVRADACDSRACSPWLTPRQCPRPRRAQRAHAST